eukprot:1737282-Rhodomonas_salina.2
MKDSRQKEQRFADLPRGSGTSARWPRCLKSKPHERSGPDMAQKNKQTRTRAIKKNTRTCVGAAGTFEDGAAEGGAGAAVDSVDGPDQLLCQRNLRQVSDPHIAQPTAGSRAPDLAGHELEIGGHA